MSGFERLERVHIYDFITEPRKTEVGAKANL